MNFNQVERELIARLIPVREAHGVLVQAIPNKPSQWGQVSGAGWVTIKWEESEPVADRYSLQEIYGEDLLTYSLDIRCDSLRNETGGLFPVVEMVKAQLKGYWTESAIAPISLGKFNFVGMAEHYWVATGSFSFLVPQDFGDQFVEPTAGTNEINLILKTVGSPINYPTTNPIL